MLEITINTFKNIDEYSTLLLAILTGVYVLLTYKLLLSANHSFLLKTKPIFFPKISISNGRTICRVENHSQYPAYDVDIWVIGSYYQEDVDYKTLFDEELDIEIDFSKNTKYFLNEPERYGIIDRVIYYAFPPLNFCEFEIDFLRPPTYIDFVMQYRDSSDNNYLYQSALSLDTGKGKFFKQQYLQANVKQTARVGYEPVVESVQSLISRLTQLYKATQHVSNPRRFLRLFKLGFKSVFTHIVFHFKINNEIRETLKKSFHSGCQKVGRVDDMEDRGYFSLLNK